VSPAVLDAPAPHSFTEIIPANNLAVCTEKLADLRFLIILTARWESSDNVDREQRDLMRQDLVRLRKQYSEQIDVIAMSFGVQEAMDAKEDVERRVQVPSGIQPPAVLRAPQDDDGSCF
jgi:hypothetical protein